MKKVIIEALKGYRWKILLQVILLAFNTYLLTCPPLIIGRIIDDLYDIEANKQSILNNTYYLSGSVGKTSTKDIVANVVSQKYKTLKMEKLCLIS